MDELLKLLKISCDPNTAGKEFINISCKVGFEPHGRASETWEIYRILTLPQIPQYVKFTDGWKKLESCDLPMRFQGRTYDKVIQKAIIFLKETFDI